MLPVQNETDAGAPKAVGWLWAAMVLSVLGPALLLAFVAMSSRAATIEDAKQRLARVAQVAQEHARRVAETNDVIARTVALATGSRSNEQLAADRAQLHQLFRTLASELPQVQSIWLWDAHGRPVISSVALDPPARLDVSDREYFRAASASRDSGWFISRPLTSRTTGQLFFDFTKRREGADGSFVGVLSVSLLPSYFSSFFEEQVRQDAAFAVALIRADGAIIARYPAVAPETRLGPGSKLLARMRAGNTQGDDTGVSTVDGRSRYLSFRRVGGLPLYAVATADEEQVLAPWRASIGVLAAFTIPLSAALVLLCWFAMRRVKLQHALARAHADEYQLRLKTEDALRHAQKLEALGHLTAGVAHDFNNLLMVVNMNATILEKRSPGERPRPLVAIQNAVQAGAKLTRQLVSFARRQPLLPQPVDFAQRLPADIDLLRTVLGSRVRLDAAVEPGTPAVMVDPNELELAFINLAVNAKDAMPEGGQLLVRIGVRSGPAGRSSVQVTFSDTGKGIRPEELAQVFEPFFTTKAPGSGTGLGLSQVKSFCQRAGGDVEIESTVNRGTSVCMIFPPLELATHSDMQQPASDAPDPLDAHILLVEDNEDVAVATRALLEAFGARVTTAENAQQALSLLGHTFDIVLTDVKMPGEIDGIEFAGRLRGSHPELPVILMTGYADRLGAAEAMGLKVLPKPIEAKALHAELAAALRRRRRAAAASNA